MNKSTAVSDIRVLILAGGVGEKLKLITGGRSKTLIKIMGKSIVNHVIEKLISSGFTKLTIVTSDLDETMKSIKQEDLSIDIDVVEQKGRGINSAITTGYKAMNVDLDEPILLVYGDIIINSSAYRSIATTYYDMQIKRNLGGIFLAVAEEPLESHGVIVIDDNDVIKQILPTNQNNTVQKYILGGIYLVKGEFLELVERYGSVIYALNQYVSMKKVLAHYWRSYWVNIGTPWDIIVAMYHMLKEAKRSVISDKARISHTATLDGIVIIDDNAEIDHFSVIKGPIYIGKGSFIGAHTFIRNYSSIEQNATIGSYTEINRSIIMDEATIGRGSYIGYSILASRSVVEPGVITKNIITTLNRDEQSIEEYVKGKEYSKIGCIVSVNSRVKAGTILEPGTVIHS